MSELLEHAKSMNNIALSVMKSGEEIGFVEGLRWAAKYCEEKAALHATYLPTPEFQYNEFHPSTRQIDPALSATCGRRDECSNLAYEIRQEIQKRLRTRIETDFGTKEQNHA